MNSKLVFVAVLLALLPSVFAANGITLSPPAYSLSLDSQTALNAVYGISNDSSQRVCFSVNADSDEQNLETIIASPSFCLNKNERTEFTLTAIASSETPSGTFPVTVTVQSPLGNETHTISVLVEQSPLFSFSASSGEDFCNNESISIPVTIQNNSGSNQSVSIEPNAPQFLPSADHTSFSLDNGQAKSFNVKMHAVSGIKTGTYDYTVTSRSAAQTSIQRFSFHIKKCEIPPAIQSGFSLETPSNCVNIAPGKTRFSSFTITNTGNTPITVWASINENDLDANFEDEDQFPVTLEPEEGVSSSIQITTPFGISEGMHYITVNASSLNDSQTRNICVFAGKPFSLSLFPNNVSLSKGDSFAVALTIENKLNESQTVSLSALEVDADSHVSFSQTSVRLNRYEQKTVIATVRTDSDSVEGLHKVRFKASNSNDTVSALVYFSVLPTIVPPINPIEPVEGVINIISYPVSVDLNAGERKELVFVVANDSNETVSNIQLRMDGLPSDIAFMPPLSFELAPLEARTVRGTVVVASDIASKSFSARLVASNAFFKSTRTVRFSIEGIESAQPQKNPFERFITGLLVFGANNWLIGLIVLALIIAWLVQSKNRFWSTLLVIIVLLIVLAVWLQLGWNPLWFVLLILILGIAGFAASWNKDRSAYQIHKDKWRQVARNE